jgi:hypothetical protein
MRADEPVGNGGACQVGIAEKVAVPKGSRPTVILPGNRLKISAAKNAAAGSYHVTVREPGGQPSMFDFTLK